jgi:hypothetical protein
LPNTIKPKFAISCLNNYAIAKQFINDSSKLPDLPTFSSKLKQIDIKKRTFFAAMLGDAIQQGNTNSVQ